MCVAAFLNSMSCAYLLVLHLHRRERDRGSPASRSALRVALCYQSCCFPPRWSLPAVSSDMPTVITSFDLKYSSRWIRVKQRCLMCELLESWNSLLLKLHPFTCSGLRLSGGGKLSVPSSAPYGCRQNCLALFVAPQEQLFSVQVIAWIP